jgi:hypothetical protein
LDRLRDEHTDLDIVAEPVESEAGAWPPLVAGHPLALASELEEQLLRTRIAHDDQQAPLPLYRGHPQRVAGGSEPPSELLGGRQLGRYRRAPAMP